MTDEKFVVFKKKDWDEFYAWFMNRSGVHNADRVDEFADRILRDAVVLRHQDLLCAPMLGLYRDMLTMVLKIDEMGDKFDPEALQKVADWMDDNAAEAADAGWKLPD